MCGNFKELAIEYVKQAVKEDNERNYCRAFPLYMNALEYFKTHLKYEKNPQIKEAITQKFTEYLSRAEEIRAVLDGGGAGPASNGDAGVATRPKTKPKDGEGGDGEDPEQVKLRSGLNSAISREKSNVKWSDVMCAGEVLMSWKQRLQIAIDVAQALKHLHHGCNQPIIHRDVKLENILLNEKLRAKIADFGLSKSMQAEGESNVSTEIRGTFGYIDPEFPRNEKIDVYSFGIVFLELISGKPAIIKSTDGSRRHILDWVRPIIEKGDIATIVDPSLGGEFETNSAKRAVKTAMSCVASPSTDRPAMGDVLAELRECLQMATSYERTSNYKEVESPDDFGATFSDQEREQLYDFHGSLNENAGDREKEKKKQKSTLGMFIASTKKEQNAMDRIAHYLEAVGITHYTPQKVESIIDGFRELTGGKYEKAYLGLLTDGNLVAVKEFPNEKGGFQNFQTEAEMLPKLNHKNLVSMIGYCYYSTSTSILIYDDVTGSLRDYLSGKNETFLSWKQRIEIALDVAQGLNYLHNDCRQPIIHRNVKSVNILFNKKLRAKLAGFRLSLFVPREGDDHESTRFCGTKGYYDPEYRSTGKLSVKSDVYSFGIVLLELVSGRPAVMEFTDIESPVLLSKWVKDMLDEDSEDIGPIVDPELHGDCDMNSAKVVVETAMACIRRNPSKRPTMSVVAWILKDCLARLTEEPKLDLVSLLGPPEEETGSHPEPPEEGPSSCPPEDWEEYSE